MYSRNLSEGEVPGDESEQTSERKRRLIGQITHECEGERVPLVDSEATEPGKRSTP